MVPQYSLSYAAVHGRIILVREIVYLVVVVEPELSPSGICDKFTFDL